MSAPSSHVFAAPQLPGAGAGASASTSVTAAVKNASASATALDTPPPSSSPSSRHAAAHAHAHGGKPGAGGLLAAAQRKAHSHSQAHAHAQSRRPSAASQAPGLKTPLVSPTKYAAPGSSPIKILRTGRRAHGPGSAPGSTPSTASTASMHASSSSSALAPSSPAPVGRRALVPASSDAGSDAAAPGADANADADADAQAEAAKRELMTPSSSSPVTARVLRLTARQSAPASSDAASPEAGAASSPLGARAGTASAKPQAPAAAVADAAAAARFGLVRAPFPPPSTGSAARPASLAVPGRASAHGTAATAAAAAAAQQHHHPQGADPADETKTYVLFGMRSHAIVLGRAKPGAGSVSLSLEAAASVGASVPAAAGADKDKPVASVALPNDAKHVSRVHALLEYVPFGGGGAAGASALQGVKGAPLAASAHGATHGTASAASAADKGTWVVRILGQNGLIVDGKRRQPALAFRVHAARATVPRRAASASASASDSDKRTGDAERVAREALLHEDAHAGLTELDFFGIRVRFVELFDEQAQDEAAAPAAKATGMAAAATTPMPTAAAVAMPTAAAATTPTAAAAPAPGASQRGAALDSELDADAAMLDGTLLQSVQPAPAPSRLPSVASKEDVRRGAAGALKHTASASKHTTGAFKHAAAAVKNNGHGLMTPPTSSSPSRMRGTASKPADADADEDTYADADAAAAAAAASAARRRRADVEMEEAEAVIPDSLPASSALDFSDLPGASVALGVSAGVVLSDREDAAAEESDHEEEEDEDEDDSEDEDFVDEDEDDARAQSPSAHRGKKRALQPAALDAPRNSDAEDEEATQSEDDEVRRKPKRRALSASPAKGAAAQQRATPTASAGASKSRARTASTGASLKAIRAAVADDASSEDDLSPPPSPQPSAPKRTRQREASAPSKASAAATAATDSQTRMPPPAAPARRRAPAANAESTAAASAGEPDEPMLASARGRVRRAVRMLAATYDLEGLLAGTIVFHRTATMASSEAVRGVLANNPGLMKGEAGERVAAHSSPQKSKAARSMSMSDAVQRLHAGANSAETQAQSDGLQHGKTVPEWHNPFPARMDEARWNTMQRKAWTEHLMLLLQESPMFGSIDRQGRDSSGNALEAWYYYDPQQDHDKERATNLKPFVKPMRGVLKSMKPIIWKKSLYGRGDDKSSSSRSAASAASEPRLWDETQEEERESTWDKEGDQDFRI